MIAEKFLSIENGIENKRINTQNPLSFFGNTKLVMEKLCWERNLVDGYKITVFDKNDKQLMNYSYDYNLDKYTFSDNLIIEDLINTNDLDLVKMVFKNKKIEFESGLDDLLESCIAENKYEIFEYLIKDQGFEFKENLSKNSLSKLIDEYECDTNKFKNALNINTKTIKRKKEQEIDFV